MLDLRSNYCYDRFLLSDLKSLYTNIDFHETPKKDYVLDFTSEFLHINRKNFEIGFGTIDIVDRLLSLFNDKTLTSIGPYWAGIKWACEKNNVRFDDKGEIAYVARPNGRDGLLRNVDFDKYEFVIIDEAYGDFSQESFLGCLPDNAILTRTFSKTLSLPGLRFAYCVSNEKIIEQLKKLSHRYSMNSAIQNIFPDAFDLIAPHITRMLETKTYLQSKHDTLTSHANFVKTVVEPKYNINVQKINNFYRFTLVDMDTLNENIHRI